MVDEIELQTERKKLCLVGCNRGADCVVCSFVFMHNFEYVLVRRRNLVCFYAIA